MGKKQEQLINMDNGMIDIWVYGEIGQ